MSLENSLSKEIKVDKDSITSKEKKKCDTSPLSSNEDDDDDDEVCLRMKRTVGTETTDTVGVQTSKSVQQLPLIKPLWYKKQKKSVKKDLLCTCKKSDSCKYCRTTHDKEDSNKKSVAYFITFDESPEQLKVFIKIFFYLIIIFRIM